MKKALIVGIALLALLAIGCSNKHDKTDFCVSGNPGNLPANHHCEYSEYKYRFWLSVSTFYYSDTPVQEENDEMCISNALRHITYYARRDQYVSRLCTTEQFSIKVQHE